MKSEKTIDFLNQLQRGMFCTINLPLYKDEIKPITAMYMGKDEQERYVFLEDNQFAFSKSFIEKKNISVNKEYDEDKATEIYMKVAKFKEKRKGKIR